MPPLACLKEMRDFWFPLVLGFAAFLCFFFFRLTWRFSKDHVSRTRLTVLTVIVPLLFILTLPNFLRARKRSAATRVLEDIRMIDTAIEQYAMEYRALPTAPSASPLLTSSTSTLSGTTRAEQQGAPGEP